MTDNGHLFCVNQTLGSEAATRTAIQLAGLGIPIGIIRLVLEVRTGDHRGEHVLRIVDHCLDDQPVLAAGTCYEIDDVSYHRVSLTGVPFWR